MPEPTRLTARDRTVLLIGALVFALSAVFIQHPPGIAEAAFAQSLREMGTSGQWAVPTVGGSAWISTTPFTQWIAGAVVYLTGVSDPLLALRIAGIAPAVLAVWWTASFAAVAFGRRTGLLAGLILLTTLGVAWNIWYGGNVIWLIAAGSGFQRLLAALEERERLRRLINVQPVAESRNSLRLRSSRPAMTVFVLIGLSALIAGPLPALATIVLPAVAYVVLCHGSALRRSPPLHSGWVVTGILLLIWPMAVWLSPGKLPGPTFNETFTGAAGSFRYAPARQTLQLLQLSMPWLPLILFGQWSLRHESLAGGCSRERLLACWSLVVPPAVFLLVPSTMSCVLAAAGAWSISAAVGLDRLTARLLTGLPPGQSQRSRQVSQRFAVATAAVLTLTIVWSGRGPGSHTVDPAVLTKARDLAAKGHRIQVDMNLGKQAAIFLLELGDSAEPLYASAAEPRELEAAARDSGELRFSKQAGDRQRAGARSSPQQPAVRIMAGSHRRAIISQPSEGPMPVEQRQVGPHQVVIDPATGNGNQNRIADSSELPRF